MNKVGGVSTNMFSIHEFKVSSKAKVIKEHILCLSLGRYGEPVSHKGVGRRG